MRMMLPALLFLASPCALPTAPVVLPQSSADRRALYQSWRLPEGTALLGEGKPEAATFAKYLEWVRANVDPDQLVLLKRQRKIFANAGLQDEVRKFDLIIEGRAGRIHPATCLENLLFNEHIARMDSAAVQTEFAALVLTRGTELKIFFSSGFEQSPPSISKLDDEVTAALAEGWNLTALLHNHLFFFSHAPGDIAGTTIPSNADVTTFIEYAAKFGLKEAWITNGISSITLTADEFKFFEVKPAQAGLTP